MILLIYYRETTILGSGAFGTVHKGVWFHDQSSDTNLDQLVVEEVAVKSTENGASGEERVKLMQEAVIMGQFNHPNIIRIMGIIITENVYRYSDDHMLGLLLIFK